MVVLHQWRRQQNMTSQTISTFAFECVLDLTFFNTIKEQRIKCERKINISYNEKIEGEINVRTDIAMELMFDL